MNPMGRDIMPEIEVLGHVHLLKDIHKTLFLGWFLDFLIKADRNTVCAFAMIKIMSSK